MTFIHRVSRTELARNTRRVLMDVQRGRTALIESYGQPITWPATSAWDEPLNCWIFPGWNCAHASCGWIFRCAHPHLVSMRQCVRLPLPNPCEAQCQSPLC